MNEEVKYPRFLSTEAIAIMRRVCIMLVKLNCVSCPIDTFKIFKGHLMVVDIGRKPQVTLPSVLMTSRAPR